MPDYGGTDDYQVSLRFGAEIRDVPFLIYIRQEQQKRPLHHKLNVFQLIAIYNVCFGTKQEGAQDVIDGLVDEGLLLRSKSGKISMPREYQNIYSEIYSTKNINWIGVLKTCAAKGNDIITRKTYMEDLPEWVSVDRVRYILSKLETMGVLRREGTGKGTRYHVVRIPDEIEL